MANIILRLSTGHATNTDATTPDSAIGGKMGLNAAAIITTSNTSLNNLFDNVSKQDNSSSTTDYRLVYIHNDIATAGQVFSNGVVYLQGSTKANISVAVATKNVDTIDVLADENSDPTGITFTAPTQTAPLTMSADNTLDIGDFIPLWIKRTANNVSGSGTVTDVISLVVRGIE